ncbi:MAG: DUF748 domain-containing protein [Polyangiales bacterium]
MKRWHIVVAVVVVVLVGVMLALPAIIKKIVESKLETIPGGYQGTIDHVEVRGLGSELALCGFTITKKNGQIPVPFLRAKEFHLLTELDGWRLRNALRFVEPEFSFVDAESEAKKQKGPEQTIETLRQKLPFELTRAEVIDGKFHFRNYQTKPDMDLYAHGLNARWDKLFGCLPPGNSACRSNLRAEAKLMKSGSLEAKGRFARNPVNDFHVTAHLRGLRAQELNPFLNEYAKVKASKGVIALDARYDRRGERHDTLMIPLLDDIEVEKAEGEDTSFLRKVGAGIATGWFERKKGEKGIAITKKPNGKTEFEIVDKPNVHDPKDAKADDD